MGPQDSEGSTMRVPPRAPFIGRETELEWLLERVQQATRGRPRACLVRGEPGIGKSRLLAELGRQTLAVGLHVWSVRGSPDLQTPYLALDALFKDLAATCFCGPALAEASEGWWRLLRHGSDSDAAGSAGFAAREQRRLSANFSRALLERAAHGGFVFLIDDFQWLDGPSLELLVDAVGAAAESGSSERTPLAVVMATRGGAPGSAAASAESRLGFELICDHLELSGFGERETEAWLASMGLDPPDRALVARLQLATGGSPPRREERLRELRRRGALALRGTSWVATLDPAAVEPSEPRALELTLDPAARGTLRALALFASPATREALAQICATAVETVDAQLRLACERGWVHGAGDRFVFEAPDLARALVSEVPDAERPALHHGIARRLDRDGEADPELLAHHWLHALPLASAERVVEALRVAGHRALRARDWLRAASHFESALRVSETRSAATVRERAELHYRAGIARFRSLDGNASAAHFEEATELFGKAGDTPGVVRARIEGLRARTSLSGAPFGFRPPDLAALVSLVGSLPEEELSLRAYATAMLAETQAMSRSPGNAEELAGKAVALSERAGDDVRCRVHAALGIVQLTRLELEDAVQSLRVALRFGRRRGDPWYENMALQRLPLVLAWLGRMDEAASYLLASRTGCESSGDWADYTLTLGTQAALANARGEFEEVERLARRAVSLARRYGYPWGGALALTALATARALRGRLEDAIDAVTLLGTPGVLVREVPAEWGALAAITRLRVQVLAGRVEVGARETAAGLMKLLLASPLDIQVLAVFCAGVEVAAAVGDVALCEEAAAPVAEAARRGVVFAPSLDDVLPRLLGLAAAAGGSRAEAFELLEAALEAAEHSGARSVEARVHLDMGRVLRADGRNGDARRHFERALRIAESLGMEPVRAEARRALADPHEASVVADRAAALEADERELLRGVARGLGDPALAHELLLTPEGLARLRARLFERIGASGNLEAAAFAHREGLVEPVLPVRPAHPFEAESAERAPPVRAPASQVLTVFVSDISNSTELIQRLGDERAQALVQEHNRLVRTQLHRHRGVELQQTGDGFIAVFDEAANALRCAVGLQREIDGRRLGGPDSALRVRVGLHTGEVLVEEGRVFGVVMHTAAHICTSCRAGEILVSHQVWAALADPSEWPNEDLGPISLKGLFEPVSLRRVK